jgi:nucleoside-diphosphate-sugar epimerase
VIIHIAWRLDFNMSVEFFEPNVRGTYNLATLARASSHAENIRFVFTSSIGVAQSWDISLGSYPEALVTDSKYALGLGYGEAKYVSERVSIAFLEDDVSEAHISHDLL